MIACTNKILTDSVFYWNYQQKFRLKFLTSKRLSMFYKKSTIKWIGLRIGFCKGCVKDYFPIDFIVEKLSFFNKIKSFIFCNNETTWFESFHADNNYFDDQRIKFLIKNTFRVSISLFAFWLLYSKDQTISKISSFCRYSISINNLMVEIV